MYNEDKRNMIGIALWTLTAVIVGIIALIPMIGREIYQYVICRKYGMELEWNDIFTYGLWIGIGGFFHYFILDYFFENVPLILYF